MTTAFDAVAWRYAELWSASAAGRRQREATWRRIDPLFPQGSRILDLGCGTGDDALHLAERGVRVLGIDASAEMVKIARSHGVDARVLSVRALGDLKGVFDGAISNFGVLNCVERSDPIARDLSRLIAPGGMVAVCLLGKCCAWEIAWYLARMRPGKAFRRTKCAVHAESLGIRVHYPGTRAVVRAFARGFRLVGWQGIGLTVPPSYVSLPRQTVTRLAAADAYLAHRPILRALADHRLYIFKRV